MNNRAEVKSFFDKNTHTVTHVVSDVETNSCAIIDSVLDYDPHSGRTSHYSADKLISYIKNHNLTVEWILETHIHADHLSAAQYLKSKLGAKIAIGTGIQEVQETFGKIFNLGDEFKRDASQFDKVFSDTEEFKIGNLNAKAIHCPGHTPADNAYLIEDALFTGDTIFMPDFGTARCDFPGGDAGKLYDSIQKLFKLDKSTRLFLCHDYLPQGRADFVWETTIGEQIEKNIHVNNKISREEFIKMRTARDSTLGMPRLIIPSVQVNMRAGILPPKENNGISYLKVPLNQF